LFNAGRDTAPIDRDFKYAAMDCVAVSCHVSSEMKKPPEGGLCRCGN
jgi:hypothetical protein